MANYGALRAYAAARPLATDAQVASLYNAATVSVRRPVLDISTVLTWAGNGPLDSIEAAAASFAHETPSVQRQIRSACKAALRLFGTVSSFNLDSPTNLAFLSAFVAGGLISQAEVDALDALGDFTEPLWAQPGEFGSPVSSGDVLYARTV